MSQTEMQPTRIALLPEVVRNQIAAGEVIERPSSVVKELVENSIDAGSTHIEIELEEGGMRLVRITDDGCGMVPEDLKLAFSAHATSKLREASDLEHIVSLGFRGEALASMGAIARCSILTRTRGAETGSRIENEGGTLRGPVDAGAPLGTCIEIRDLFYNTPGRRHFLKRAETELARCLDVVQRAALSTAGVGFVVLHNGKRVLDVEASMDLRARIRRIFGTELGEELVPVSAESDGLVL
ncbi:MAG: DNA mismatch repair endonuclease MutL, partial [Planctomycetota bacterium]